MHKILTSIVEMMNELVSDNGSPLYFQTVAGQPHGIRRIFHGDPNQIPSDDFPAVIVRPVSTKVLHEGTRDDTRENMVEILIVDNLRNYAETSPKDPGKVQSLAKMMDMMELADEDQQVSASSVLGKMLKNPRLPYTDSGTQYAAIATRLESIDYVFNSSRGFPTFEVIAVFRVLSKGDRA